MCGIAGQFLRERNAELAHICAMCDAIRHRGPDHEGYHIEGRCGIGMRRLSIIDLATGQQPIANEDQSIWVVLNGEIYNYRDLRTDLTARGHRFKTESDTEVLVHLYEDEGPGGIHRLRGMFAFAIWDSRDRSLLLARDRFGKKPLYIAILPDGLYFASELKSLRAAGVPLDLDRNALQLYFALNYIPDPWSPYQAIRKLAPGSWLRFCASGKIDQGRYWTLPAPAEEAPTDLTEARACRRVRELFDEAVRIRLVSDEPFGDSSAIPTYLVSEFAAQHVKVVLTGDGGDELFAGYESFLAIQRWRKLDRIPLPVRQLISTLADALPYSAYGKNYLRMISRPTALERYFENHSPHFLLSRLLAPEWMLPADAGFLTRTLAHCLLPNGASTLSQALYFEATAKLTGDMLVKVDRMSMANSIEVRCPMLDHKLAEFAAQIPHAWKLRNGRGKDIFIRANGHRLPPEILRQPKRGFAVPLAIWFRGPLRNLLWDHLTSSSFLDRGIVSPAFVNSLLDEHDRGRRDNYHWVWNLLVLELWFREAEQYTPPPSFARPVALSA